MTAVRFENSKVVVTELRFEKYKKIFIFLNLVVTVVRFENLNVKISTFILKHGSDGRNKSLNFIFSHLNFQISLPSLPRFKIKV